MNEQEREALQLYQCEYNRNLEEAFAQTLGENEQVRLFFINEGRAYTDGRNIVVDPALGEAFADRQALAGAEAYLGLAPSASGDAWYALRLLTRGQNIHESLHILFTDFPGFTASDPRADTKARRFAMEMISNIIEDAFIEAAGCSLFDRLIFFLQFLRLALMYSRKPRESTASLKFKDQVATGAESETPPLIPYLEYMITFLLYPMAEQEEPETAIRDYVMRTKALFLEGSACPAPAGRHVYCQQIFDIIEPLIPAGDGFLAQPEAQALYEILPGHKTHGGKAGSIETFESRGREARPTRRLFGGLDGKADKSLDFGAANQGFWEQVRREKGAALDLAARQERVFRMDGKLLGGYTHQGIAVTENHPRPNVNLRRAYMNVYRQHRLMINAYSNRFAQLLKARVPFREERRLFGTGISTRRLWDSKKRYWYRDQTQTGVPDLAVLLLIDGSGSMYGERQESAMQAALILHEVLGKQGIPHAVVEHRAGGEEPSVDINVILGFFAGEEDKLNLMSLSAGGDNRDGLALLWSERYLARHTHAEQKLMIVLADGQPAHSFDDYYPPASAVDTAKAAQKIIKRGTHLVAVALDEEQDAEDSCYEALKGIYPHVISCTDLNRLTGQLLGIVSRQLR